MRAILFVCALALLGATSSAAEEEKFGVIQVDPRKAHVEQDLLIARAVVQVGDELRLLNFCADLKDAPVDCDSDGQHITLRITRFHSSKRQVAYEGKKGLLGKALDVTVNAFEGDDYLTVAVMWDEWFGFIGAQRTFKNFSVIEY